MLDLSNTSVPFGRKEEGSVFATVRSRTRTYSLMLIVLASLSLFLFPLIAYAAPPVIDVVASQIGINQSLVVINLPFTDDPGDTHSAAINWGDGIVSPGLIINGAINGAHVYGSTGTFAIGVVLTDNNGESTTYNTTINVTTLQPVDDETGAPLPATGQCAEYNGIPNSIVRAGVPDAIRQQVYCRLLVENGSFSVGVNALPPYGGSIGNQTIISMGVYQAVDVFSPPPTSLTNISGTAICLRGSGQLYLLNGSPRSPFGLGGYSVPTAPGYTCGAVSAPGTVVLIGGPSTAADVQAAGAQPQVGVRGYAPGLFFAQSGACTPATRGTVYVRAEPYESARQVAILGHNTPVTLGGIYGQWYVITTTTASFGTVQGFIRADLLSFSCGFGYGAPPLLDESGAVG